MCRFSTIHPLLVVVTFIAALAIPEAAPAASPRSRPSASSPRRSAARKPPKPKPWTPIRLSAWPHPSAAFPPVSRVRGLSVILTASRDEEVFGIQLGPVVSVNRGAGLQIGAAPEVGSFHGIQAGLLSAGARSIHGLQISPLNNIDAKKTRMVGCQLGAFNGSDDVRGMQVGFYNRGKSLRGLQAGALNQSGRVAGGVQIGVFNSCESLAGIQIGLLNRVSSRRFLAGVMPILNVGW